MSCAAAAAAAAAPQVRSVNRVVYDITSKPPAPLNGSRSAGSICVAIDLKHCFCSLQCTALSSGFLMQRPTVEAFCLV